LAQDLVGCYIHQQVRPGSNFRWLWNLGVGQQADRRKKGKDEFFHIGKIHVQTDKKEMLLKK
jgi:hypothetical protein